MDFSSISNWVATQSTSVLLIIMVIGIVVAGAKKSFKDGFFTIIVIGAFAGAIGAWPQIASGVGRLVKMVFGG
jgi:hypothetical protein